MDLALNWLLNVYDRQRQGFTRVLSFKLGVTLLCQGPLAEKYSVMFCLAAGEMDTLDQRRLGLLLYDLVQIPRYLGEVAQFGGSNIEPSVRCCMSIGGVTNPRTEISCDLWLQWCRNEPQSLVWLPVLHRLATAEIATHDVKCNICKVHPIQGFRYHCRKCFNLDICHTCFFQGKSYKGHKSEHPMVEYSTSTNKTDNARHILQAVRNSFRSKKYFKKKQAKLSYLPVQSVVEGESFETPVDDGDMNSYSHQLEEDEHSLIATYCNMLTSVNNNNNERSNNIIEELNQLEEKEVEQMVNQLKEENKKLETEYSELLAGDECEVEGNTLRQQKARLEARMAIHEDHNRQLEAQLERLRQLVASGGGEVKCVVASQLDEGKETVEHETRPQPPALRWTEEGRNSGTSGSLDLSHHHTETLVTILVNYHSLIDTYQLVF